MFVMHAEAAAIRMVERGRGDLFAVSLADRSLIVQMIDPLHGADTTVATASAGMFAFTKDKPEELWLRIDGYGSLQRCQYLSHSVPCPKCGSMMSVVNEKFVCHDCEA